MTITDVAGLEALHVAGNPPPLLMADGTIDWPLNALLGPRDELLARLPAVVLSASSPRTVTPEQVEAGAIAVIDRDGAHYMGGDKWETSGPVRRAHGRNLVTAALSAMGIGVQS